ncbi:GNAT family N-acetyltransferase [Pseudarthrobacter sp. J75]|uniref:GNAT family N-acetyltransferase n=1 Tax=unclassified Pseudarthrobacter TaxID=2647000 RepID=UPI002E81E13E|nr:MULTISPECIES: GNAT family N-acetyltransferase [unclassified Pseudarthrobacter]MEE2524096.1 GNAT family N-acetyltransferase [Pseudarthrobacter sp. J47]MEE2530375.1 GNAT family N-acetyltransferase [Pseudarthrobacter sp. J75]MEE2568853.1 GNAT family N-acetyltransferase [Pseudarthrobacter sp. J64]
MSGYRIETPRLKLRRMVDDDLDNMAALLGDPAVMCHYPAPKTREEAKAWIDWNKRNYAEHDFGLWIMESRSGDFLGDCGLTLQEVDGVPEVEVGYHVLAEHQGRGYASEAAAVCLEFAARSGVERVIAIINPANIPSQRVAVKCGLQLEKYSNMGGLEQLIFATNKDFTSTWSGPAAGN